MSMTDRSDYTPQTFTFSNLPPDAVSTEEFSKDVKPILVDTVKESLQKPLEDKLTQALSKFGKDLEKKIERKTLEGILDDLNYKEDEMMHQISQDFLEDFKQKFYQAHGKKFSETSRASSDSSVIKDDPVAASSSGKTQDELSVYLETTPEKSQRLGGAPPVTFYETGSARIRREFLFLILTSSFLWGLVGIFLLTFSMPLLFFRPPQIFLAVGTMLICLGLANSSEYRYFRRTGLFISLHEKRLIFRPIVYLLKICLCLLPLSLLLLTNVYMQNLVPYPSPFAQWWFSRIDGALSTIFILMSPKALFMLQKILFYTLLIWIFVKIFRWVFQKSEV